MAECWRFDEVRRLVNKAAKRRRIVDVGEEADELADGLVVAMALSPKTPDSLRTKSSNGVGGRRKGNHWAPGLLESDFLSTFLRTSNVNCEKVSKLRRSRGLKWPNTSRTAISTFSITSVHPRFNSHQLKVRYLRLVSKSLPYACSGLSSSLFSSLS